MSPILVETEPREGLDIHTILDGGDIGLIVFDDQRGFGSCNAKAQSLLNIPREGITRGFLSNLPWCACNFRGADDGKPPFPWSNSCLDETGEANRTMCLPLPDGSHKVSKVRARSWAATTKSEAVMTIYFQDITAQKKLSESLRMNTQLLEASQAISRVGGWELDLETNELFWTDETYRIHETTPEQFNPSVDDGLAFYPPETRRIVSKALEAAMTLGEGFDLELDFLTAKQNKIQVRATCDATLRDRKPVKLTGTFQDITAAKQTEAALRQAAQFSQDTLNALDASICVLDETGTIVAVNETWLDYAGDSTRVAVERRLNYLEVCDRVQGEDAVVARNTAEGIRRVLDGKLNLYYTEYPCCFGEENRWFSMRVSRFRSSEQPRVVVAHVDITERWRAQRELEESQTQLRELARRLQQATEQESQRIAGVVHDDLGQQLTGLKMDLRAIERLLAKGGPADTAKALQRTAEATQLVDETVETVQRIASDLRPAILDQLGLWAALREEVRLLEKRSDLICNLKLPETEPALADNYSTNCYRIVREALTNIVRHAKATRIDLTVEVRDANIFLRIEDDGRGIRPGEVDQHGAMGLLAMRERARQLGGVASIFRRPAGGTGVHVKFPLSPSGQSKETP